MGTTEQRVRRAAIELFAERGFHGTGIRDLAERAGLSSATLYHYMGTKEDLLVSIMRESLTRLVTAGERLPGASPQERVAGLVQLHVLTHAVQQEETRVVDDEMRSLTPARRAEVVALRDRYEALWQSAIDDGCSVGAFTVSAPRVARLALLEMCSGVARWYAPDGPIPLPELAVRYTEMALGLLGGAEVPPADVAGIRVLVDTVWASQN
ncbi:TetR/AcrR family transcriptional regulator [Lentzea tibetensis]|uniref:TetR/AcrR family transcriptional regulator n=1 Tax=Lentzea tibetensis TaxID=2591470 RepID=A0A563ETU6_9PSEU|nr:TetR/AcrR family transcriptional regulator [Lentzea tibetensis]TWP50931.1 TetR/AcrR family transcriptional regulator [Lentzea tibetensis]